MQPLPFGAAVPPLVARVRLVRLFASTFALALTVLVTVQTFDVVPCADEAEASGGVGHSERDPGESLADCLCHISFVPTVAAPTVPVPVEASRSRFAPVLGRHPSGPADVPHPPPLG